MINDYKERNDLRGAWKVYDEILERRVHPNEVTFSTLITGLFKSLKVKEALNLKKDIMGV
ncbi:hypothetical protein SOVF_134590 [Spinacia oleracea]|nr:hypothetical protein SOVF_134590 [Spinacia oleracea]